MLSYGGETIIYIIPKKEGAGHFVGFRKFWGIQVFKILEDIKPDISSYVAGSYSFPTRILT